MPGKTLDDRIRLLGDLSNFADKLDAADSLFNILSEPLPQNRVHVIVKVPCTGECANGP